MPGRPPRRALIRRLVQLYVGLLLYGLGCALEVRGNLGLDPWDVFHQGVSKHLHIAIGTVVIIVGAAVLLLWWPLRQWPGVGTVSNVVFVGLSMNWSLALIPYTGRLGVRIPEMLGGILLLGVATGMYIGAAFGPGPRDGLMTGFARRSKRSIRLIRTVIELTVLAAGFALGGTVGIGTVLFALAIGPLAQLFLPIFDRGDHRAMSAHAKSAPPRERSELADPPEADEATRMDPSEASGLDAATRSAH